MLIASLYSQPASEPKQHVAVARYANGECAWAGEQPDAFERIAGDITLLASTSAGVTRLSCADDPVAWLRGLSGEMRTPYSYVVVHYDDEPGHEAYRESLPKQARPACMGEPAVVWVRDTKTNDMYWQAGMCPAAPPVVEDGEDRLYMSWQPEFDAASEQHVPPRAQSWPLVSVRGV